MHRPDTVSSFYFLRYLFPVAPNSHGTETDALFHTKVESCVRYHKLQLLADEMAFISTCQNIIPYTVMIKERGLRFMDYPGRLLNWIDRDATVWAWNPPCSRQSSPVYQQVVDWTFCQEYFIEGSEIAAPGRKVASE